MIYLIIYLPIYLNSDISAGTWNIYQPIIIFYMIVSVLPVLEPGPKGPSDSGRTLFFPGRNGPARPSAAGRPVIPSPLFRNITSNIYYMSKYYKKHNYIGVQIIHTCTNCMMSVHDLGLIFIWVSACAIGLHDGDDALFSQVVFCHLFWEERIQTWLFWWFVQDEFGFTSISSKNSARYCHGTIHRPI